MSRSGDHCPTELTFIIDFNPYYNCILMTRKIFAPIINRVKRSNELIIFRVWGRSRDNSVHSVAKHIFVCNTNNNPLEY